jgi:hypothetical protein
MESTRGLFQEFWPLGVPIFFLSAVRLPPAPRYGTAEAAKKLAKSRGLN